MTSEAFLSKCAEHQGRLETYLQQWHPRSREFVFTEEHHASAPGAQFACNRACAKIQKTPAGLPPVAAFKEALEKRDVKVAYSLLNDAWFGLPETTEWRQFEGAREAVGLIEDPPDDVEWADEDC